MKTTNEKNGCTTRSVTQAVFFAAGFIAFSSAFSSPDTSQGGTAALGPFAASAGTHESRGTPQIASQFPNISHLPADAEIHIPAPTRSSFMAVWKRVTGAAGYRLDVATDGSFSSSVNGYRDLDVGNVTGRAVTGLNPGTTYYYRVHSYTAAGSGEYSNITTATTAAPTGLIINPTFDSSITNNQNAAAIEAMINRAVSIYESIFSDPITVQILFRYANTGPEPNATPYPSGSVARSNWVYYTVSWNTFINALIADARTSNDNTANASLPGSALSTSIKPASSNGRSVGLNTPPAMFADGHVGTGGPYDGIVSLNSAQPFQFTRPVSGNSFDAQRFTEHEIDEVMGLGSFLNLSGGDLRPQDLFSWSSAGVRNTTSSGDRYFSLNSGGTDIVDFNQTPPGDFGDWLSEACPQTNPYVQNAIGCTGEASDVSASSPEGINLDVIGYDLAAHPRFFTGEVLLGNGIYYLQFPNGTPFGYYSYLTDPHWIYHFDMGYEYWFDANDGHNGIFLYDFAANTFFYTSPSFPFPYLYDFGLNALLYYYPDPSRPGHYTSNPRYFYNFATHQIITR